MAMNRGDYEYNLELIGLGVAGDAIDAAKLYAQDHPEVKATLYETIADGTATNPEQYVHWMGLAVDALPTSDVKDGTAIRRKHEAITAYLDPTASVARSGSRTTDDIGRQFWTESILRAMQVPKAPTLTDRLLNLANPGDVYLTHLLETAMSKMVPMAERSEALKRAVQARLANEKLKTAENTPTVETATAALQVLGGEFAKQSIELWRALAARQSSFHERLRYLRNAAPADPSIHIEVAREFLVAHDLLGNYGRSLRTDAVEELQVALKLAERRDPRYDRMGKRTAEYAMSAALPAVFLDAVRIQSDIYQSDDWMTAEMHRYMSEDIPEVVTSLISVGVARAVDGDVQWAERSIRHELGLLGLPADMTIDTLESLLSQVDRLQAHRTYVPGFDADNSVVMIHKDSARAATEAVLMAAASALVERLDALEHVTAPVFDVAVELRRKVPSERAELAARGGALLEGSAAVHYAEQLKALGFGALAVEVLRDLGDVDMADPAIAGIAAASWSGNYYNAYKRITQATKSQRYRTNETFAEAIDSYAADPRIARVGDAHLDKESRIDHSHVLALDGSIARARAALAARDAVVRGDITVEAATIVFKRTYSPDQVDRMLEGCRNRDGSLPDAVGDVWSELEAARQTDAIAIQRFTLNQSLPPDGLVDAGRALASAGRLEEAMGALRQVRGMQGESALLLAADIAMAGDMPYRAATFADEAYELRQGDVAMRMMATALHDAGEPEAAKQCILRGTSPVEADGTLYGALVRTGELEQAYDRATSALKGDASHEALAFLGAASAASDLDSVIRRLADDGSIGTHMFLRLAGSLGSLPPSQRRLVGRLFDKVIDSETSVPPVSKLMLGLRVAEVKAWEGQDPGAAVERVVGFAEETIDARPGYVAVPSDLTSSVEAFCHVGAEQIRRAGGVQESAEKAASSLIERVAERLDRVGHAAPSLHELAGRTANERGRPRSAEKALQDAAARRPSAPEPSLPDSVRLLPPLTAQ